jgi:membrane associated rhomboid family serine protease
MIPIRIQNSSKKIPILTNVLIFLNVGLFLYMFFLPEKEFKHFISSFALFPYLISQGEHLFSLLSSMFLHGSFGHLFGNMLFLHIFGNNLEGKLGRLKYFIFYIFCGVLASLFEVAFHPHLKTPMVGASGAIAGLLGGYLRLFPYHKVDVLLTLGWYWRVISLPAWTMLIYWFLFQLISGLGSLTFFNFSSIAYAAHLGGFLTGFFLVGFFNKNKIW